MDGLLDLAGVTAQTPRPPVPGDRVLLSDLSDPANPLVLRTLDVAAVVRMAWPEAELQLLVVLDAQGRGAFTVGLAEEGPVPLLDELGEVVDPARVVVEADRVLLDGRPVPRDPEGEAQTGVPVPIAVDGRLPEGVRLPATGGLLELLVEGREDVLPSLLVVLDAAGAPVLALLSHTGRNEELPTVPYEDVAPRRRWWPFGGRRG
jgi:hypothetical protein